jgi:hypothetical protein
LIPRARQCLNPWQMECAWRHVMCSNPLDPSCFLCGSASMNCKYFRSILWNTLWVILNIKVHQTNQIQNITFATIEWLVKILDFCGYHSIYQVPSSLFKSISQNQIMIFWSKAESFFTTLVGITSLPSASFTNNSHLLVWYYLGHSGCSSFAIFISTFSTPK